VFKNINATNDERIVKEGEVEYASTSHLWKGGRPIRSRGNIIAGKGYCRYVNKAAIVMVKRRYKANLPCCLLKERAVMISSESRTSTIVDDSGITDIKVASERKVGSSPGSTAKIIENSNVITW